MTSFEYLAVHANMIYHKLIFVFPGIVKYSNLIETDTAILRVLFAVYMVAGNFILLNLFISVISEGLSYMTENPEEAQFDEELANFLRVSRCNLGEFRPKQAVVKPLAQWHSNM